MRGHHQETSTGQLTASSAFAVTGAFVTNIRYANFARQSLQVALLVHVLFAVMFLVMGVNAMIWVNLVSIAVYGVCLELFHRRKGQLVYALVTIELLGHAVVSAMLLGGSTGFQYYAWILIPLAATSARSTLKARFWRAAVIGAVCLLADFLVGLTPAKIALPATTINLLHTINLGAYLAIMAVLSFVYANTVAQAEHRLHKHATTDALTGLRNRRRTLELARAELARARRTRTPVSVIVCDIDRFKNINDQYGHPFGDQVIISAAGCLRECVRLEDHVARWGGEEFLVVLPGIDLENARTAAERMRIAIRQIAVQFGTTHVETSASFGVAEWRSAYGESFEQCLARADMALYTAKQDGRDRVSVSPSPTLPEQLVAEVLDPSNSMRTQALSSTLTRQLSKDNETIPERNAG